MPKIILIFPLVPSDLILTRLSQRSIFILLEMICLDHVIAGEKLAAECGGGGYLSQEYQSDKELVTVETPSVGLSICGH